MARLAIIACVVAGAAALGAGPSSDTGPDRIDVSSFPPEMQQRYLVFAEKCSKCHTLARPINAQLKGGDWKNYIKKMIRRPSSGINEETGRRIFEFLKFYSDRREGNAALPAN